MKVKELFENKNTNVLICDIQPEYDNYCGTIIQRACQFLNNQKGRIVSLYNGQGLTNDEMGDVYHYFLENDIKPQLVEHIEYWEKEYGFFRTWMDAGISDSIIIKVIRAMIQARVNDSSKLNLSTILTSDELKEIYNDLDENDGIGLPSGVTVKELRDLSPFYLIGGGRFQCLREIELLCNAFNIKYKRINNLIY